MLAIAFYRPSYSHIFISIHRRSARFGKSDRHTHRLATPFTGMQISASTFFIAFAESTPLCDIPMCEYPTHAVIAVFTAHCTSERKFSLGVDCPKVQSNLTEAFLPYILASLKCTLLDKVKTNFPFVCSLTVHIAIREKGGFRSRDAGRSGGLFRQKKGKYPFSSP